MLRHRYSSVLMAKPDMLVGSSGSGDSAPFYRSARPDLPNDIRYFSMLLYNVYMEHSQISRHDLPEIITVLNIISLMGSTKG